MCKRYSSTYHLTLTRWKSFGLQLRITSQQFSKVCFYEDVICLIYILLTPYSIVINSEGTFSSIVCNNKDYIRCCYIALLSLQLFKWFQHSDPLLFSHRQCIHVHRLIIVLHLMISIHLKILRFPQCIGLKWFSTKSF